MSNTIPLPPRAGPQDLSDGFPASTIPEGGLIDASGVAAMMACSVRHVRRLDAAAELPAPVRIGRLVRWRLEELSRWLDAGCPDRKAWEAFRRRK
jgi:predicted DNA-binding transcriptional regulator AlpA